MKKKIGILTSIGIGSSNIVYGIDPLYGIMTEPSDPNFFDILLKVGKIAILPVILIIGVIVIVKVNKKKKIKKVCEVEKNLNSMTKVYGVFRDDEHK